MFDDFGEHPDVVFGALSSAGRFGQRGCCRQGWVGVVAAWARWLAGAVVVLSVCPRSILELLG